MKTKMSTSAAAANAPDAPPDNDALYQVHQAMEFVQDCEAYQTAVRTCPEVVQRESPPSHYLAFCQGNSWQAAARLAAYWRIRQQVFGSELSYGPLSQALTTEQQDIIDYLLCGVMVITGRDKEGRVVLAGNGSRVPKKMPSMECRLKSIFLTFQVLSQSCQAIANFEHWNVIIINPQEMGRLVKTELDLMQQLIETAMCIRTKEIHLFLQTCTGSKRTILQTLMPMFLAKVGGFFSKIPHICHVGSSVQENMATLLQQCTFAITPELLPTTHGGTFCYDRDWPQVLLSHEILTREQVQVWMMRRHGKPSEYILLPAPVSDSFRARRGLAYPRPPPTPPNHEEKHQEFKINGREYSKAEKEEEKVEAMEEEEDEVSSISSADPAASIMTGSRFTDCSIDSLLAHPVHQAMEFVEDCQAYQTAVQKCPMVVARESPLPRYLAFCEYNAWEAATRLARYWTLRQQVFQEEEGDRAFKPLQEALSQQEREYLLKGVVVVTGHDNQGVVVLAVDRTRVPTTTSGHEIVPLPVRMRCIFTAIQILNQISKRQAKFEFLNLVRTHPQGLGKVSKKEMNLIQGLLQTAVCSRPRKVHFVIDTSAGGRRGSKRTVIQTLVPMLLGKLGPWFAKRTHAFHVGNKSENLTSLLNKEGSSLEARHLPTSYGGAWTYETDWPRMLEKQGILESTNKKRKGGQVVVSQQLTTSAAAARSEENQVGQQQQQQQQVLLEKVPSAIQQHHHDLMDIAEAETDPACCLQHDDFVHEAKAAGSEEAAAGLEAEVDDRPRALHVGKQRSSSRQALAAASCRKRRVEYSRRMRAKHRSYHQQDTVLGPALQRSSTTKSSNR